MAFCSSMRQILVSAALPIFLTMDACIEGDDCVSDDVVNVQLLQVGISMHSGKAVRNDPGNSDTEKIASLHTIGCFSLLLAASWLFYFTRKDLFPDQSISYVILCCFSFSVTSVSMHTLNKVCVSFTDAPSVVTSIQMIMALVLFMCLHTREVLGANREQLAWWCIVPVAYAGMLNSSLFGYKYLTLTLVMVFRSLAPLITLAVEGIVMPPEQKPTVTLPILISLFTCIVGAVVFSWTSSDFSWLGLGLIGINTGLAIFDRLLQRRLLVAECKDLPVSACMTVNNSLGLIPSFAIAYASQEFQHLGDHVASWTDPAVIALLIMSGFMGVGIGVFALMCQKAMTATSFQVMQNVSKIIIILVGVRIFHDKIDGPFCFGGIFLNLVGSAAYGYIRALEVPTAKKKDSETEPIFKRKESGDAPSVKA